MTINRCAKKTCKHYPPVMSEDDEQGTVNDVCQCCKHFWDSQYERKPKRGGEQ